MQICLGTKPIRPKSIREQPYSYLTNLISTYIPHTTKPLPQKNIIIFKYNPLQPIFFLLPPTQPPLHLPNFPPPKTLLHTLLHYKPLTPFIPPPFFIFVDGKTKQLNQWKVRLILLNNLTHCKIFNT